ncbi:hypothetical protein PR370_07400 [Mycobacterium marinum]|uniref:hypothetical protein n=1 Tax=Mycobacterium marinum TaxID=1781 RepID=UPI00159568B9|nr:hypothetical protein [Mycobacterium marinum]MDC8980984.1 hypothetical protein [Mycobacterium marinum]MDC8993697.1 hypothetical protein [Mycobacterium marinum]MDC8999294.1 hypothetical protein [Mycobacterium marinum]MDC9009865.1 hypothetical protein [Mycobacterium marinum]WDZ14576.1 hypothetical protein PQR73_002895 [Mycobacterium marinum]
MGRHELARKRRKPSVLLAAVVAPAAAFFAVAGDIGPSSTRDRIDQMAVGDGACCVEIVAATPIELSSKISSGAVGMGFAAGQFAAASRLRVDRSARLLPVGVAPERGLQVKTILAARSISAVFPEIHEIGGVRPDALRWHPNGLALDVMIPNPGSAEGIALGNEIVAYVLANAERFGMQDAIWRGVYYTPTGATRSRLGHYDHVHVTTTGGGYPTGKEIYLR